MAEYDRPAHSQGDGVRPFSPESRGERLWRLLGGQTETPFSHHNAAIKVMHHRSRFSAFLAGRDEEITPICAEIIPSLECNCQCPACTYIQNRAKARKSNGGPRHMTQETYDLTLEGLSQLGTMSLIFTGGGEPRMSPQLLAHMEQAKSRGFEIGLYTNGSLWTNPAQIEQLMALEPAFVRVSLNAATPTTHARIFGYRAPEAGHTGKFERAIKAVIQMGKLKRRMGIDTSVGVGILIGDKNMDELRELTYLLHAIDQMSEGGVEFAAIRPEVRYFDENLRVVANQPNAELFAHVASTIEEIIGESLRASSIRVLINRDGFDTLSQPYNEPQNLATPWSTSVGFEGNVYMTSEHNGMDGFAAGNVHDAPLPQIWHGERRKRMQQLMASGEIPALPYHKLSTLHRLLKAIRSLGTFTQEEIADFYQHIDLSKPPRHVNII